MSDKLILLEEKVEELRRASEDLRGDIRAAHEATARLRELKKEIKHYMETEAKKLVQEAIEEAVAKGLDSYSSTIKVEIDKATTKVYQRFDDITNILLTGKKSGDGPVFGIPGTRPKG